MLLVEARWFYRTLKALPPQATRSVMNIGSSTLRFRTEVQPHIDREIFRPLRESGCRILHVDLKADDGVDLAGDLTDPDFQEELQAYRSGLLLCSNLLEHIDSPQRELFCEALQKLMPSDGYLAVSVPFCYPHHRDPIDTMFRPSPVELAALFPSLQVVKQDVVMRKGLSSKDVRRRIRGSLLSLVQGMIPGRFGISEKEARLMRRSLALWTRQHSVSCVLLQKADDSKPSQAVDRDETERQAD